MPVSELQIHCLRNISKAAFEPSAAINIICGLNGSGKTSVLEAINLLGLARSFRTSHSRHFIKNGEKKVTLFARIDPEGTGINQSLGVERTLEGDVRIRHEQSDIELSTLAGLLPLQVINADSFLLLDGSPSIRRQFVDWGVFHSDSSFIQLWRSFKRVLKQRNTLLKCGNIDHQLRQAWDKEFIIFSEQLTQLRQRYLAKLEPVFNQVLSSLLNDIKIELTFYSGWDKKRGLDEILASSLERDLRQGFTGCGPQRADLKLKISEQNAAEHLSRGQKKLVVSALKLAQGALFQQIKNRPCIYLIDDLPSELDSHHGELLCKFLEQGGSQCFITCVDYNALESFWSAETKTAIFTITDGSLQPLFLQTS